MTNDKNSSYIAALHKKSFELCYNGGSIWCEHLDGMGNSSEAVKEKFMGDYKSFCRPSVSSYFIINLDETEITSEIADTIIDTISNSEKRFMKLAFVGVPEYMHKIFRSIAVKKACEIEFFKDFEKAKKWNLP